MLDAIVEHGGTSRKNECPLEETLIMVVFTNRTPKTYDYSGKIQRRPLRHAAVLW
jgi:hypothetical protein